MTNYARIYNTNVTRANEPIPGREKDMIKGRAGGYVFELDDWKKLDRFLILGSDQSTYYAGARELTKEVSQNVVKLLKEDGIRVISRTVEISKAGRAYKNDPALYVLALAFSEGSNETKAAARAALPQVARTGTHLFTFVDTVNSLRGWGSSLKKAVASWYQEKEPKNLAYQVTKYAQRNGWSHRDVLRLSHPVVYGESNGVLKYVACQDSEQREELLMSAPEESQVADYLAAVEDIKKAPTPKSASSLIRTFSLPREVIPTHFLNSLEVWDALLNPGEGRFMPMTAMIRNLGVMTSKGLLKPMGSHSRMVVDRLLDENALSKARIHPIQVLAALITYKQGHGARGSLSWTPVGEIVDALDEAFYLSFGNVEPTNKRRMMALDVSGSMTVADVSGVPGLTASMASAALAMVSARTEKQYYIMGFANSFRDLGISPRQRLDDVIRRVYDMSFGSTDCSLPMVHALDRGIEVDSFEVYTDNETWVHGRYGHPVQALQKYRRETGIPATLTVVGMVTNDISIADPNDAGMLDVVGFDTSTPNVISDFVKGNL